MDGPRALAAFDRRDFISTSARSCGHRALERAAAFAGTRRARRAAGAPLAFINLGGGFGVDYEGGGREFPLERWGDSLATLAHGRGLAWVLEPGRWLTAPIGVLVAEVLAIKSRDGRRFVVLAAGMNDLIRPALYGARHRIVPVAPRAGVASAALVVGPVCERRRVRGGRVAAAAQNPAISWR